MILDAESACDLVGQHPYLRLVRLIQDSPIQRYIAVSDDDVDRVVADGRIVRQAGSHARRRNKDRCSPIGVVAAHV